MNYKVLFLFIGFFVIISAFTHLGWLDDNFYDFEGLMVYHNGSFGENGFLEGSRPEFNESTQSYNYANEYRICDLLEEEPCIIAPNESILFVSGPTVLFVSGPTITNNPDGFGEVEF